MKRRDFIKGLSVVSGSMLLDPEVVLAAAAANKRIIFIHMNDGVGRDENFWPTILPHMAQGTGFKYGLLNKISGNLTPVLGTDFDALKSKMNLLRGLDLVNGPGSGGHSSGVFLAASPGSQNISDITPRYGSTVDVLIEKSSAFYPLAPKMGALRVRVSNMWNENCSWIQTSGGTKAADVFSGDIALYNYVKLINPTYNFSAPAQTTNNTQKYTNIFNTIIQSFLGGLTKLAVINVDSALDITDVAPVLHHEDGHGAASFDASYSSAANARYLKRLQYVAKRVANLATILNEIVESDGTTMLDNTMIVWGSDLSTSGLHSTRSLPILTIGGGAWIMGTQKYRTGYYVDYRTVPFEYPAGRSDYPALGRPYNSFLVTIMKLLGMPSSEYMNNGDGKGFGAFLPSDDALYTYYSSKPYSQFTNATRNVPLPFLLMSAGV